MEKYLVNVRFGLMGQTENFVSSITDLKIGQCVIMRSSRGIDHGEVAADPELLDREVKGLGEIMRIAAEDDIGIIDRISSGKEPEEFQYCKERIVERKLKMKLAGIEHLFGGDKMIFYFLSDGRVDFRELVKDLARRYRTRIEMRQIGVRDEARLLSDYEHCGQELCCRTFMHNLEPVTMRMAKMQKTTLDPTKISGHCGRLMCCLRFEDEVYTENKKELPNRNERVSTDKLTGNVVSTNILTQVITIQLNDGSRERVHISDLTERGGRGRKHNECNAKDKGCGCKGNCGCANKRKNNNKDQNRDQNKEQRKTHDKDQNRDRNRDQNRDRNKEEKKSEPAKEVKPSEPKNNNVTDAPITPESMFGTMEKKDDSTPTS